MASNSNGSGAIHRWIEKKPLSEAILWTPREKYWLLAAAFHYGTQDWRPVIQAVKNAGEPYRPRDWFTLKNCQRQYRFIVSGYSKDLKSLPFMDMLKHIVRDLHYDYVRDINKSRDILKAKYCTLLSMLTRARQGNLSRSEIVSLYTQAKRIEIEGKKYLDQLMRRQNACVALENANSGESAKWNAPSAPLLTSLLRSRNSISANRTATTIPSLLQSPTGTSRTRSGKLLPLSPNIRTSQGTPTLSKLLQAPANPYLPSSSQSLQRNNPNNIGTDNLAGNTSKNENSESTSLNRIQIDNMTSSFNQINKFDYSASKGHGSKGKSSVVNLLSDSENDEDTVHSTQLIQTIYPRNSCGNRNDNIKRLQPRTTRSQTRAEGGFKQLNELSFGKREQETLRQQSEVSQIPDTTSFDDELIDIDQIDIEPLFPLQDEIITPKITRSSMLKPRVNSTGGIVLTNKVINKEINNQMLEEISANFVLNSKIKNVASDYKSVFASQSHFDNANISGCLVPVDGTALKDGIILCKDVQPIQNSSNILTTFDGKLIKQKRLIELKGTNLRCIDSRNESTILSFSNQPIVVVNKLKKPYNIKLSSEVVDKNESLKVTNIDPKKAIRPQNNPQNLVQLLDGHCSLDDEIIIIDDDVNINVDDSELVKIDELSAEVESNKSPIIIVDDSPEPLDRSKFTDLHLDVEKNKNDKSHWKTFSKPQNQQLDTLLKKSGNETGSPSIKELDFDIDQSISQTSLSELYNGVEEIVEMHSFDNEELSSLIECGSLGSYEMEVCQNEINLDHGVSLMSENSSTTRPYNSFSHNTRSPHKSSSNIIKSPNIESQTVMLDRSDVELDESFIQPDEIDDQNSTVSVPGIPILQCVISDVMSKIDSDPVATLNNAPTNDIVIISSDDDETIDNIIKPSRLHKQDGTSESDKGIKDDKLKAIKLIQELETKTIGIVHGNHKTTNVKSKTVEDNISQEIHDTIIQAPTSQLIITNSHICTVNNKIMEMESIQSKNNIKTLEPNEKFIKWENLSHVQDNSKVAEKASRVIRLKEETKAKDEYNISEGSQNPVVVLSNKYSEEKERQLKLAFERRKDQMEDMETKDAEKKIEEIEIKKDVEEEIMQRVTKKTEIKKSKCLIKLKEDEIRKSKEAEILKRFNEVEVIRQREAEILQQKEAEITVNEDEQQRVKLAEIKVRDSEIQIAKQLEELRRIKETELKRAKEEELQKSKEEKLQRAKEEELRKAKEEKFRKIREEELKKAKEVELKKVKEENIRKAKEEELRKAKDEELRKAKEEELRKAKEEELRKAKEEESRKIKEEELRRAREEELRRAREEELRRAREEELRRAREEEVRRAKEEQLRRAKEEELRKAKEEEIRINQRNELKKSVEGERFYRKMLTNDEHERASKKANENERVSKKAKENERAFKRTGNNNVKKEVVRLPSIQTLSQKEREENSIQTYEEMLENEIIQLKNKKISEIIELKKKISETAEVFSYNKNLPKDIEKPKTPPSYDGDKFIRKYNITKRAEIILSKQEEMEKVIENEKKKSKAAENATAANKFNTRTRGFKAVEKLKESRNVKIQPGLSVKLSSSSVKSTSTEDSSISNNISKKQTKNVDNENKLNNLVSNSAVFNNSQCDKGANVNSNENVKKENTQLKSIIKSRTRSSLSCKQAGTKTKILPINTHNEVPTTSSNFNRISGSLPDNFDKLLAVPVVKLTPTEFLMKEKLKVANNKHLPQKSTDPVEKPAPKKRGRKRKIDIQNEQLQQSRSCQPTFKNGEKKEIIKTFTNYGPPAKRTRRSTALPAVPYTYKMYKSVTEKKPKKKVLKMIYNNLLDSSKYVSSIEKEVKNLPDECSRVIKEPILLRDINRKINSGEIKTISKLQLQLLKMTFNAVFINKSDTIVYSDASNFQAELALKCKEMREALGEDIVDYDTSDDENKSRITTTKHSILELDSELDSSDDDANYVPDPAHTSELIKRFVYSSDESEDCDYDHDSSDDDEDSKDLSSDSHDDSNSDTD